MRRTAWLVAVGTAALLSGCVERRFVVTTDPPGAVVLRNGKPLGASPVDDTFVYYGDYQFTLIREGYETQKVVQNIPAPWYQYFPLDFISENLIPWTIKDVRYLHFPLQPLQTPDVNTIHQRAEELRDRGRALQPLTPPPPGT